MVTQPPLSADFLADLDAVCSKAHVRSVSPAFESDLNVAYAAACTFLKEQPTLAVTDFTFLAEHFQTWRRHYQELLRRDLTQLPSDDPLVSPVSLFGTMDYGRLETAHTRVLAWLLDGREHGFGHRLLEALLHHLLEGRQISRISVDRVESEYPTFCGTTKEGGRLDVFAEGTWAESGKEVRWALIIEGKIDAEEGEEQLTQYDGWLKRFPETQQVLRVFLTPDGRAAQTSAFEWKRLSFLDLSSVFRRVPRLEKMPGYHFLRYYLTGVLRDICGLPVPISAACANPYVAVDYLQNVLNRTDKGSRHGESW